jgi:hypothetical protein
MYLSWFDRYHFYAVLDDVDDDLARKIRERVGAGGMPHTYPEIANWAGYSLGHRGRRLREAIELSKWIALRKLKAKLGGIKLDDVWPLLLEICHDLALYIGGSAVAGGLLGAAVGSMGLGIGAVPGALAGTAAGVQIGQMLLGFIGLKSVIEFMLDQLPVAIDEYRKGFLVAWGPMPTKQDMFSETPVSRYNFESNAMAAGNFARGHEIIIIALLMGIVTYLGKGKGNLKALMAEATSHSKLGPKFAAWLEQNAGRLKAHPMLQTQRKGGGQAGSKNRPTDVVPKKTGKEDAKPTSQRADSKSANSAHSGSPVRHAEPAMAEAANRSVMAIEGEAAPGPANFMGSKDQFFKNASRRLDIDSNGSFDVVAHGSTQQIEIITAKGTVMVDQRVASRLIQDSPGYHGQPIRLLSCETGACDTGFAQNLANKMGVPVQAPTNLVWAYADGSMVVAPRMSSDPASRLFNLPNLTKQGTFRTFTPGKP